MQTDITQPPSPPGVASVWGPPAAARSGTWGQVARILAAAAVFDVMVVGGLLSMIVLRNALPLTGFWSDVAFLWPVAMGLAASWVTWRLGARMFFAPVAVVLAAVTPVSGFVYFYLNWVPWGAGVLLALLCLPAIPVAAVAVPARAGARWAAVGIGVALVVASGAAVVAADTWAKVREFDATVAELRAVRLPTAAPTGVPDLEVEVFRPLDREGRLAYTVYLPDGEAYWVATGGAIDPCSDGPVPAVDAGNGVRTSLNTACVTLDGLHVGVSNSSTVPPIDLARLMTRTDTSWLADHMVRRG